MNKPLVIFGAGDIAQLAYYYFTNDSDYQVCAFTIDAAYITDSEFCGLPVIAFDEVAALYPPQSHDLFVALSYSKRNAVRKDKYLAAKALGYKLTSYISSHATVLNEGNIGENCFIFEDNTIQPFVTIGNNVTLWSGNHIGHHSRIGDHSFISSQVVISGHCDIGAYSYLGVNCSLRDGLEIGEGTFIAMGATVTKNTEAWGSYFGSPAKSMKRKSTDINIYHELD